MDKSKLDLLHNKIDELEKKKIAYIEIDNNSYAKRIQRQIDKVQLEIRLFNLDKIEKELRVYKKIVSNYPELLCEIKKQLLEQKIK